MNLADSKASFKKRQLAQPLLKKVKYTSNVLIQSSSTSLTNDNNSSEITEVSQYEHAQISRKVYQVLKVLKSSEIPLSQNELIRNLAFDVFQDTLLFNALIINEKISFNEKEKTFSYKPVYDLTCKEDLLRILKDASRFGGVDATELYDSWSLAKETLLEMEIEYSALLIKNKDGIPRLCFWNDPSSMLTISNDFKELWHKTDIPAEDELQRELEKAGLKGIQIQSGIKSVLKKGMQRKSNKRTKITNTHLVGVDLKADLMSMNK